ncbi:MAG: aminotransferase class V-fold PLP-dependent enzyme [Pseudomonadota bacterium]
MSNDFDALRLMTPGGDDGYAHFNAAGAALMDQSVLNVLTEHQQLEARIGGYEAARQARDAIESFYPTFARLLNAAPDEIAFMENATRAWQAVFYSLAFKPGDRILTCENEYASNYIAYLQRARRDGVEIDVAPTTDTGDMDVAALEAMVNDRTRLISITHVPTSSGSVAPAAEIGAVAKKYGVPYLLDACQSVGQMPIDVAAIGCDMLSATGRKYLRGPRATGVLYVSRAMQATLEPYVLDLHSAEWTARAEYDVRNDARRFENWEQNIAGKLALARAGENAAKIGLDRLYDRIQDLAATLRAALRRTPGVEVLDRGAALCGIVAFNVDGWAGEAVRAALFERGVAVSVIDGWNTRIDAERRGLNEVVRASVHYYTNEADIEKLIAALRGLMRS